MYKKNKTYELEVHFGLLVLVVIMLCLNIFSNYVIYNARNIITDDITGELNKSSLTISRHLQNNQHTLISETDKNKFLYKYNLDDLTFVSSVSKDFNKEVNLQKLQRVLSEISPEQTPCISKAILKSDYYTLQRSENNKYFFITPVPIGKSNNILILFKKSDKLAYLDDSSDTLATISMITVFAIILIYILLYRFILSPFRKLKEKAKSAGRNIPSQNYEVGSVINEYQIIIRELKEKETELIKLHNQATHRADSFEQFNDYLLGSMQAGIITIDKYGKILNINIAAEKMCQIESHKLLNTNFTNLSFLSGKLKERIEKTLKHKLFHSYEEYQFQNLPLRAGITISPVCDNDTHQIGASILINDISEIKKLQNELEKTRQVSALGEMSAGLAHQLRNSLGAIVGYNQLVKKRLNQNNIETNIVDSMAAELKESEHLIKRFLNFTKPFDYSPEKEQIAHFVEDIIETLSVREDFKQISIHLENKLPENSSVSIDVLLLKQALINVIENSKNAYDENKGNIHILLTEDEKDNCLISIQDYACGIDKENLSKIFTPFYSTNPSGTGLGLPLAQKIIVLHKGNLKVESIVGKGTTFKIQIPLESKKIKEKTEILL